MYERGRLRKRPSTGFPCSRRRRGCQGRTSLGSLDQSQAPGRRAAGNCNERNTAMRSCCDAATGAVFCICGLCVSILPVSNLNSARRAARGRFSTIVENRRALYQEGARSSRLPSVRVDQKASSLRVVGALAFCSLRGQRSPDPLGSLQALAIPRRGRRSSCSFSTQSWRCSKPAAPKSHRPNRVTHTNSEWAVVTRPESLRSANLAA